MLIAVDRGLTMLGGAGSRQLLGVTGHEERR